MEWLKKDERLYTNTTACFCSRPRITYEYPILRTLFISISYVLKLGLGANQWLSFPFLFGYSKDRFLFKGDLYYHQCTRGGDTETRGIFPSRDTQRYHFGRVASKRGRRDEGGRRKKQKRQQGGEVVWFFFT
ncbi:hypothetical protein V8C34DRAFT_203942 [Trichoderma compactum]